MKNAVTLESLKQAGFKVFLKHAKTETGQFETRVAIYHEGTKKISTATATVHPNDQFSRKKGRAIALGRAFNPRTRTILDTADWSEERLQEYLKQVVYG